MPIFVVGREFAGRAVARLGGEPMTKQALAVALIAALLFLPGTTGCASFGSSGGADPTVQTDPTAQTDPTDPAAPGNADPVDLPDHPPVVEAPKSGGKPGVSMATRAQSAIEGLVLGAVIGAQAGPIGAAVGAGTLMLYGAVTGRVPLSGGPAPSNRPRDYEERREEELEEELDREIERGDDLESQIEAELKRQEVLLDQIEEEEAARQADAERRSAELSQDTLGSRTDTRQAPEAPEDRALPLAIFEKETRTIEKGEWGNSRELEVIVRSLDADEDGQPEQIRYFDEKTGEFVRKELDRDYDGKIDAWHDYENGNLVRRALDEDSDGTADAWEDYRAGRMAAREVDRDHDGTRDAFYTFVGDSLVEEQHDANNDGVPDLIIKYEDRLRVTLDEDRDRDGRIDHWTKYTIRDGEEIVETVRRDTSGDGKADVFESYDGSTGKAVLAKREEDRNGDGEIDVTSIYKKGKLVKREISNPDLVPL